MRTDLIQKIASYGDKYIEKNLSGYNENMLLTDWHAGLEFLFDHFFYQGRRDNLSERVKEAAKEILDKFIEENNGNPEVILNKENFPEIESRQIKVRGKGKVGRGRDIEMVISILEFISKINDNNIVKYSLSRIQNGIVHHFNELQTIRSIGPKCSSFYLRDLNCIYPLDKEMEEEDLICLQPIDVWVKKVAIKAEIINKDEKNEKEIRTKIVNACLASGVSATKFNQGAWYLGYYSFDILIDNLKGL